MSNVTPIKIDTTDGRLPIKEKGLVFQEFANPAEERRNQLEKLAAGFRLFDYFGFNEGVAGHITYRDPEFKDHFWVNPLGVHFSQISVSDFVLNDFSEDEQVHLDSITSNIIESLTFLIDKKLDLFSSTVNNN